MRQPSDIFYTDTPFIFFSVSPIGVPYSMSRGQCLTRLLSVCSFWASLKWGECYWVIIFTMNLQRRLKNVGLLILSKWSINTGPKWTQLKNFIEICKEDLMKWKDVQCSWMGRCTITRVSVFSQLNLYLKQHKQNLDQIIPSSSEEITCVILSRYFWKK